MPTQIPKEAGTGWSLQTFVHGQYKIPGVYCPTWFIIVSVKLAEFIVSCTMELLVSIQSVCMYGEVVYQRAL